MTEEKEKLASFRANRGEVRFLTNGASKYRDTLELLRPYEYYPATHYFYPTVIPEGYKTDNASVPDRLAWFINPNDKRIRYPSWFHDYVWENKVEIANRYGWTLEELRKISNKEFQAKCIKFGLSKYKAFLMYLVLQYSPQAKRVWRDGLFF